MTHCDAQGTNNLEYVKALALISQYSPPDCNLLATSSGVLWVCSAGGDAGLSVVKEGRVPEPAMAPVVHRYMEP